MMTLRLKRCVSLFVCFSLLVSACSPDKSSKAGSKANNKISNITTRTTKIEPTKVNSKDSFCDKHKWCSVPRDTGETITSDREIGKVGGLSITPKRMAVGTVAVLAIVAIVSFIGVELYEWRTETSTSLYKTPLPSPVTLIEKKAVWAVRAAEWAKEEAVKAGTLLDRKLGLVVVAKAREAAWTVMALRNAGWWIEGWIPWAKGEAKRTVDAFVVVAAKAEVRARAGKVEALKATTAETLMFAKALERDISAGYLFDLV